MFTLDLSLRRNSLKSILLSIPLFSENLTSMLSPVLGQYGVDISSFIEVFLTQVRFFRDELTVRVFLTLFTDNTFTFYIVPVSCGFILKAVLNGRPALSPLSSLELYRIIYLHSIVSNNGGQRFLNNTCKNLRGYISSHGVVSEE